MALVSCDRWRNAWMEKKNVLKKYIVAFIIVVAIIITAIAIIYGYINSPDADKEAAVPTPSSQTLLPEEPQEPSVTDEPQPKPHGTVRIRVYTAFRELDDIIERYAEEHWDFDYLVLAYTDELVYSFLDIVNLAGDNLKNNTEPMDLFCVPAAYMSQFAKGEFSEYVCTYEELGIDVDSLLEKMDIPRYIIEAGTNRDGKIAALPVLSSANVFLYRRSVAREIFGTDDPDVISGIIGGGTQSWDKFLEAAQTLKEHGYYIVPGCEDMTCLVDTSCPVSGLMDENFRPDPAWEKFMDVSKILYENGCIKDIEAWSDEWFNIIKGEGDKVFGIVTSTDNCYFLDALSFEKTYGDWAVCLSPFQIPADLYSGVFVSKHTENKELIKPLIEWITLDSSKTGLQYRLANGTFNDCYNYPVVSRAILKESFNSCGMIDGQDMNPIIYESLNILDSLSPPAVTHDIRYGLIFNRFLEETRAYIRGEKDKETAIADFIENARKSWEDGTRW